MNALLLPAGAMVSVVAPVALAQTAPSTISPQDPLRAEATMPVTLTDLDQRCQRGESGRCGEAAQARARILAEMEALRRRPQEEAPKPRAAGAP